MIDNKNKWLTQNFKGMKKLVFLFASIFMLVLAAEKVSAQGDVTAKITTEIGIEQNTALSFGSIAPGDQASVVTISTTGTLRTLTSGNATLNVTDGGAYGAFTVGGTPSAGFDITLPTDPVTLDATTGEGAGTATMTVNTFTSNPSGSGTIGATGSTPLNIGASLNIAVNQVSGDYSGTYDVTVVYN